MSQLEPLDSLLSDSLLSDKDVNSKCKLIYNNTLNTNTIQNILLISSGVTESQLFYESANSNTFPIIYSPNSDKDELIELLRSKFLNGFKRITFAFHDPLNNTKTFLDNKPFFDESDLVENQTTFSEIVTFLTNLITEFKVENCDFLACNTLQYANWKNYYELLNKLTNVICGASNDKTGNIQYGADWVMENTNENVRDIYFTSSISNYASSLAVFTVDYVTYTTDGSNVSITGFSSPPNPWNLVIPATITDASSNVYNVTSIGNYAFYGSTVLRTVSISDSVTSIGDESFRGCSNLSSVDIIGNSLINIGNQVFLSCIALTSINIPDSVTSIDNGAFFNCTHLASITISNLLITSIGINMFKQCFALTSITIPDSVTSIGNGAFDSCTALTSIIIPNSVTSIGTNVFYNCSALTSITVDINNATYSSDISGVVFNKLKTTLFLCPGGFTGAYNIPNSVTNIGDFAFTYCIGLTSIIIPDSVTSIGNSAFQSCTNLTSIIIPDLVINIGDAIFYECSNLTSITFLGNLITSIGNNAFGYCLALTTITIPSSVTSIDDNAFQYSPALTSINIPNLVTSIGSYAFGYCLALRTVTFLGNSVTSIGTQAFRNCISLTSITIPDSVISINYYAFYYCLALTSITIGSSVTSIVDYAFTYCIVLTSIIIPDSVITIGNSAFQGCSALTTATIGSSVTSIGDNAFQSCVVLTSIIIPKLVTSIGNLAFNSCSLLTSVTFLRSTIPSIGSDNFTISGDTAYYKFGTDISSLTMFTYTSVIIIPSPTIQPWYSGGIQKYIYESFTLTSPTSNSSSVFTYTSSNPSIANVDSITGKVIIVNNDGSCNITATQAESNDYLDGSTNSILIVSTPLPLSDTCFPAKTPIRTDQGLIHIDKINHNLNTIRNKKIVAITKSITQDTYVVCFEKDSLGLNMPSEKTIISKNHLIYNNGKMTKAKEFVKKYDNVYKVKYNGEILYNVLLEEPNKMMVNNLICETLHPKNEIAKLYKLISNFNLKQQSEIIKRVNENTIKNNILTSNKK